MLTATFVTLSSLAMAREDIGGQSWHDAGMAGIAAGQHPDAAALKMAMGPISAPLKPSGTVDKPIEPPVKCTLPYDPCSNVHRRLKYPRRYYYWD